MLRHAYRDLDLEDAEAGSHGVARGDSQLRAIFASMGKTTAPAGRGAPAAALTPSVKASAAPKVKAPRAGHTPKVAAPKVGKTPHANKPHSGGHNPLETVAHVAQRAGQVVGSKTRLAKETAGKFGEAAVSLSGAGHKTVKAVTQEGEAHHFGLTHSYSYGGLDE